MVARWGFLRLEFVCTAIFLAPLCWLAGQALCLFHFVTVMADLSLLESALRGFGSIWLHRFGHFVLSILHAEKVLSH